MLLSEVRADCPALVDDAVRRLGAHRHLTMATVRADGSPRISGTEVPLVEGEWWLAGMTGARRFADLRRDPRVAVHSGSDDPPDWTGDAKFSAVAREVLDPAVHARFRAALDQAPEGPFELFALDVLELSVVRLDEKGTALVIDSWHHESGLRRSVRA